MLLLLVSLGAERVVLPIVNSQPEEPARRLGESDACRDVDRGLDRSKGVFTVSAEADDFTLRWDEGQHPVLTASLDPGEVQAGAGALLEPGDVYLSYLLDDGTKVHLVSHEGRERRGLVQVDFKLSLEAVDALSRSGPLFRRWTVDGVTFDESPSPKAAEKAYLPMFACLAYSIEGRPAPFADEPDALTLDELAEEQQREREEAERRKAEELARREAEAREAALAESGEVAEEPVAAVPEEPVGAVPEEPVAEEPAEPAEPVVPDEALAEPEVGEPVLDEAFADEPEPEVEDSVEPVDAEEPAFLEEPVEPEADIVVAVEPAEPFGEEPDAELDLEPSYREPLPEAPRERSGNALLVTGGVGIGLAAGAMVVASQQAQAARTATTYASYNEAAQLTTLAESGGWALGAVGVGLVGAGVVVKVRN